MEFIDTHCHLQFDAYQGRVDEVIATATQARVARFVCVGTSLGDSEAGINIAKNRDNVWATAGVHPHEADNFLADSSSTKKLIKLAEGSKVVAIGEVGLDYYKMYSAKKTQEMALRRQLEVGLELNLPFVFHIREAWESFWPVFDSYKGIRGVVHSFSTHTGHLDEALARGLYIGLNGIMTFTEDKAQLAAAKIVPLEKSVLETDAPFLTPAAFRNDLCEPKHLVSTAKFLAELRSEKLTDLAVATTANAVKLFGLEN